MYTPTAPPAVATPRQTIARSRVCPSDASGPPCERVGCDVAGAGARSRAPGRRRSGDSPGEVGGRSAREAVEHVPRTVKATSPRLPPTSTATASRTETHRPRPSSTASTIVSMRSSITTRSAASCAAAVLRWPRAMPTSASGSRGRRWRRRPSSRRRVPTSGRRDDAHLVRRGHAGEDVCCGGVERASSLDRVDLGSRDNRAVVEQAELRRDALGRARMVTGDHHDVDAGRRRWWIAAAAVARAGSLKPTKAVKVRPRTGRPRGPHGDRRCARQGREHAEPRPRGGSRLRRAGPGVVVER